MFKAAHRNSWDRFSLSVRFLLAGGTVMLVAMFISGAWVSTRVEQAVVQNAASSTAMFMESFMSPIAEEIASEHGLSDPARLALSEIFYRSPLAQRIVAYRIWGQNAKISHESTTQVQPHPGMARSLKDAWNGETSAWFGDLEIIRDGLADTLPLLAVYSPVREAWTGKVIAVVEFHESADTLRTDIADARRTAWLVVGGTYLASGLLLFGIVAAGGRTIKLQKATLVNQLKELKVLLEANEDLRKRNIAAAARASAQNDRVMRRVGFELHDGPAQHIALAALRLESALSQGNSSKDGPAIKASLAKALEEIRIISRGLSLPDLDRMPIPDLMRRICRDHENQSGMVVELTLDKSTDFDLDYGQKLCVYRFIQETLSNVYKHADVDVAQVVCTIRRQTLCVTVIDHGVGFEGLDTRSLRSDGGQGLFSLLDRAESIGGHIELDTSPGYGSRFTLHLPLDDILRPEQAA